MTSKLSKASHEEQTKPRIIINVKQHLGESISGSKCIQAAFSHCRFESRELWELFKMADWSVKCTFIIDKSHLCMQKRGFAEATLTFTLSLRLV